MNLRRFPVYALAALLLMAACGGSDEAARPLVHEESRPANIIFIVLDTTRADHLSLAGWGRDTSPQLDAFARDAVVYTNAHSVAPWTLPAHMSMFTGLLPGEHGATWQAFDVAQQQVGYSCQSNGWSWIVG